MSRALPQFVKSNTTSFALALKGRNFGTLPSGHVDGTGKRCEYERLYIQHYIAKG